MKKTKGNGVQYPAKAPPKDGYEMSNIQVGSHGDDVTLKIEDLSPDMIGMTPDGARWLGGQLIACANMVDGLSRGGSA